MSKKRALITGITGQDGSYLSELLLHKGYEVHGIERRASLINTDRIDHLFGSQNGGGGGDLHLHYGDMTDSVNLTRIIKEIQPDEIYNLAAMSHVAVSFDTPEYTANADGIGTLRILEAVRFLNLTHKTRIYQASTSELFGKVVETPQKESTPFHPRSPYGVAKLYAYWITVNYREAYNMFACNGILFNHESPMRGETFVTRKITRAAAKIAFGAQKELRLGNLSAKRDWGHAKDYVRMMWMILQASRPEDWVIATGQTTTVREFARLSFAFLGIDLAFSGDGVDEKGVISSINSERAKNLGLNLSHLNIGDTLISVDPSFFRPAEVELLLGDPTKAERELGWQREFSLQSLVDDMMAHDLDLIKKDQFLKDAGFIVQHHHE